MKRVFCIIFAILLCILCTACVGESTDNPNETNPSKEETEDAFKVLLVCEGDAKAEDSQAAMYLSQLQRAAQMVGMTDKHYAVCDRVTSANGALLEAAVVPYLKDGYDVVIGFEEGYAPTMKQLAAAYPRVTFVQSGAADPSLSNYYAYEIKMYESAYLCGLVAGFLTKSGHLGLVVSDTESAKTHQIANAFLLGAQVKKPSATLLVAKGTAADRYSNAVGRLNRQGCSDVLFAVEDTEAVSQAADSGMRVYTLYGKHSTETVTYQVSPNHQNQLGDTLQAVLSETAPSYNGLSVGMADGFFRYEMGYEQQAHVNIATAIDAWQKLMYKGQWDVFSGVELEWDGTVSAFAQTPVKVADTTQTERIPAGAGVPTADTLNDMNWWMQGIAEES